jgi:hypothetical protein
VAAPRTLPHLAGSEGLNFVTNLPRDLYAQSLRGVVGEEVIGCGVEIKLFVSA